MPTQCRPLQQARKVVRRLAEVQTPEQELALAVIEQAFRDWTYGEEPISAERFLSNGGVWCADWLGIDRGQLQQVFETYKEMNHGS